MASFHSSPPGLTRWSMLTCGNHQPCGKSEQAAWPHGLPGQARQRRRERSFSRRGSRPSFADHDAQANKSRFDRRPIKAAGGRSLHPIAAGKQQKGSRKQSGKVSSLLICSRVSLLPTRATNSSRFASGNKRLASGSKRKRNAEKRVVQPPRLVLFPLPRLRGRVGRGRGGAPAGAPASRRSTAALAAASERRSSAPATRFLGLGRAHRPDSSKDRALCNA